MQTKTNPSLVNVQSRFSPEFLLTLGYLSVSILWILLSDLLAVKLAGSSEQAFQQIQGVKGIFFVLFSGFFLFIFSRKLNKGIKNSSRERETLEEKFRALNNAAREGIYDYDIAADKAMLNDKMKFFFPSTGTHVSGFWQNYKQKIHPDDTERVINEFHKRIKEGNDIWQTEFKLRGRDNSYYTVISNTYIIRDAGSKCPVRLIGAIQDVSDLVRLQTENYEQRIKYKYTLAASIIKAQETERNRWAQELHDNVCQLLAVANMYASEIISKPGKAETIAPELKKLLMESISEIRQLSAHIKPPCFTGHTLRESIQELAANINRVDIIRFYFDTDKFDEALLYEEQKLMIYRILQEQMSNITKYAAATDAHIKMSIEGNEVKISISDNGKGFDAGKIKTGIGLRNIQSRLQVYKGSMNIRSSPGKGCTLFASFQLMPQLLRRKELSMVNSEMV